MDFTNCEQMKKGYDGAGSRKISVMLDNDVYMLKFPIKGTVNDPSAYSNSCFSEHLGCSIFQMLGVVAQNTVLGTYNMDGKDMVVVACRDFVDSNIQFMDFTSVMNTMCQYGFNGNSMQLNEILKTIEEQTAVPVELLMERFWDMFIVDALIGNPSRYNSDWGFLYNTKTDTSVIAPVFDCDDCLFPKADEQEMQKMLSDNELMKEYTYFYLTSAIMNGRNKIQYYTYISSYADEDCNKALKRIVPQIDMEAINGLIADTPYLTDLQREFYRAVINERKEWILDNCLEKLLETEHTGFKFTPIEE